jgi:hypothetical protein
MTWGSYKLLTASSLKTKKRKKNLKNIKLRFLKKALKLGTKLMLLRVAFYQKLQNVNEKIQNVNEKIQNVVIKVNNYIIYNKELKHNFKLKNTYLNIKNGLYNKGINNSINNIILLFLSMAIGFTISSELESYMSGNFFVRNLECALFEDLWENYNIQALDPFSWIRLIAHDRFDINLIYASNTEVADWLHSYCPYIPDVIEYRLFEYLFHWPSVIYSIEDTNSLILVPLLLINKNSVLLKKFYSKKFNKIWFFRKKENHSSSTNTTKHDTMTSDYLKLQSLWDNRFKDILKRVNEDKLNILHAKYSTHTYSSCDLKTSILINKILLLIRDIKMERESKSLKYWFISYIKKIKLTLISSKTYKLIVKRLLKYFIRISILPILYLIFGNSIFTIFKFEILYTNLNQIYYLIKENIFGSTDIPFKENKEHKNFILSPNEDHPFLLPSNELDNSSETSELELGENPVEDIRNYINNHHDDDFTVLTSYLNNLWKTDDVVADQILEYYYYHLYKTFLQSDINEINSISNNLIRLIKYKKVLWIKDLPPHMCRWIELHESLIEKHDEDNSILSALTLLSLNNNQKVTFPFDDETEIISNLAYPTSLSLTSNNFSDRTHSFQSDPYDFELDIEDNDLLTNNLSTNNKINVNNDIEFIPSPNEENLNSKIIRVWNTLYKKLFFSKISSPDSYQEITEVSNDTSFFDWNNEPVIPQNKDLSKLVTRVNQQNIDNLHWNTESNRSLWIDSLSQPLKSNKNSNYNTNNLMSPENNLSNSDYINYINKLSHKRY